MNPDGLRSPWKEVRDTVTGLILKLQGEIVASIGKFLEEESEMQLNRFPKVVEKVKSRLEDCLKRAFETDFDPWLKETLLKCQSLEFFPVMDHESQVELVLDRVLGCIGIAVNADLPEFTKEDLIEKCREERNSLEKQLENVQRAISELENLVSSDKESADEDDDDDEEEEDEEDNDDEPDEGSDDEDEADEE